ncbi:hypothetical protein FQN49_007232 [Arthroderma sp. PD_2]|nr:hypothetical protein FQN49_007232 [Arthroderma sp. PD_2]
MPTPAASYNRDRERERYGPYDGPSMSSVPSMPSAPTPTPSAPPTNGSGMGGPHRNFARPSPGPYAMQRSETAPPPSHGQGQCQGQQHPHNQQQPQQGGSGVQNGSYPSFNP